MGFFALIEPDWENGAPGEIRTPDLLVRSQTLYPAELRAHFEFRNSIMLGKLPPEILVSLDTRRLLTGGLLTISVHTIDRISSYAKG